MCLLNASSVTCDPAKRYIYLQVFYLEHYIKFRGLLYRISNAGIIDLRIAKKEQELLGYTLLIELFFGEILFVKALISKRKPFLNVCLSRVIGTLQLRWKVWLAGRPENACFIMASHCLTTVPMLSIACYFTGCCLLAILFELSTTAAFVLHSCLLLITVVLPVLICFLSV